MFSYLTKFDTAEFTIIMPSKTILITCIRQQNYEQFNTYPNFLPKLLRQLAIKLKTQLNQLVAYLL